MQGEERGAAALSRGSVIAADKTKIRDVGRAMSKRKKRRRSSGIPINDKYSPAALGSVQLAGWRCIWIHLARICHDLIDDSGPSFGLF